MSSEIFENDNALFVGESAWHGLGQVFDRNSPPTLDEAVKIAFPWEPVSIPVYGFHPTQMTENLQPVLVPFDDSKIIGRVLPDGTFAKFGIVSDSYEMIKNEDLFRCFQPLIESGLGTIESAFSMKNGAKQAISVKLPGSLNVRGDEIVKYALLSNGHDGQTKAKVILTPVRVVCANTLAVAENKGNKENAIISVKHTKNVLTNIKNIVNLIDAYNHQFLATEEQFQALATKEINQEELKTYVKVVFNVTSSLEKAFADIDAKVSLAEQSEEKERRSNLFDKIATNFVSGAGNKGRDLWDAYNAVTQYLTHERGNKNTTASDRLHDQMYGNAKTLSDRALSAATMMLTR